MDYISMILCIFLTNSSLFLFYGVSGADVLLPASGYFHTSTERNPFDSRKRCETLTENSCKDFGYNQTFLPNLLNHNRQEQAGFYLHEIAPLIKSNCSDDLKLLVCAIFYPPCTILTRPVPPCKRICLSSKNGCEHLVVAFGFKWPDFLNCHHYTDDEPCVSRSSVIGSSYNPPNNTETEDSYIDRSVVPPSDRFACPVHLSTPKDSDYRLRLNGKIYLDCATPCDGLLFNKNDKKIIRGWILTCSIACLLSSFFTLFTHLLEPRRFGYPEKALKFLSICYIGISSIHVIGLLSGDSIACDQPLPPPQTILNVPMISSTTQGNSKSLCSLTFMGLYFFDHSSYIWFTIMTLTWFIAFSRGWGREGFEQITGFFHVFAWAIPCAEAIRIIILKRVEGDPLSGVCYHNFWIRGNHIECSGLYVFYLLCSIIFLIIGLYYSCRLHHELKAERRDTYKMDNLLLRVTGFSIFYLLSSFILIACNIYETTNLDSWMLDWQQSMCLRPDSGIPCPFTSSDKMPKKPIIWYFLLKYAARLVPGITLSAHLCSQKTIESWSLFIRKICPCLCCTSEPIDSDNSMKI